MTPETIKKLEEAFAFDCTIEEACFYADISHETYYNFLEKNPEYVDRFKALRQRPILEARKTIVSSLKTDVHSAYKYLSKKLRNEFGDSMDITSGGNPLKGNYIILKDFDGDQTDDQ